jgi:hypothetical protein
MEAAEHESVVDRTVADYGAKRIEVAGTEQLRSRDGFPREVVECALEGARRGALPFDDLLCPRRSTSCSLQEGLVAIDSIVAIVEP